MDRNISYKYFYDFNHAEYIAYIGDSNTQPAFSSRWESATGGWFARSDVEADITGDGTLTIYDDSTATWAAFGDTAGAVTAVGEGFVWLESGTAGKGCCFNITATTVTTDGTELGNPITIEIAASPYIGSANFSPCQFGQMTSGQALTATANFGVNGIGARDVYERTQQVFTTDSFGRPTAIRPNVVGVLIGINDVIYIAGGGLDYDVDDVKGWLTGIKDAILAGGAIAVFGNLVKEAPTAGEITVIAELNAHIASMAAANPTRVRAADYHAVCNGVAGAMSGAHFTNKGAQLGGNVLAPILVGIAGAQGQSAFRLGGVSPSANLLVNGALAGTAGTPQGTMTGVVAIDTGYFGAGACVGSKEAVSGQNDWQVYTVTGAEAGDFIFPLFEMNPLTPDSDIYAEIEIVVTGAGIVNADFIIGIEGETEPLEETHSCSPIFSEELGVCSWIIRLNAHVPTWYFSSSAYMAIIPSVGDSVVKIRNAGAI